MNRNRKTIIAAILGHSLVCVSLPIVTARAAGFDMPKQFNTQPL